MTIEAVRHAGAKDDSGLAEEAHAHLVASAPLQLVAELLTKLRRRRVPWWTPEQLRSIWSVTTRFEWWRDRPDVRQRITTAMTGLLPKAARKKEPAFQGALVDAAIDDGDIEVVQFEDACDPRDLAAYGPAVQIWRTFRDRFPWDQETPVHQEVIAWLFHALVSPKSSLERLQRTPILSHWELRRAIDPKLWQSKLPVEVRVAIDDARLTREHEKAGEAFRAEDELAIATPEVISAHLPLRALQSVLDAAEKAMGFAGVVVEVARPVDRSASAEKREAKGPEKAEKPAEKVERAPEKAEKEPEKVEKAAEKAEKAPEKAEKPAEKVEEKSVEKATAPPKVEDRPTAPSDAFEAVEALASLAPKAPEEPKAVEPAPETSAPAETKKGDETPAPEAKTVEPAAPAEAAPESTPKPDETREAPREARVTRARNDTKDLFAPSEPRLTPMPQKTPIQAAPPPPPRNVSTPPVKTMAPLPPRKSAAAPPAPPKPPSPPPAKAKEAEKPKPPEAPVDSKRTTVPPPSGDEEWIPITTDPISTADDEK